MIRFTCSVCKTILQVADEHEGAVIACPTCQARLRAPAASPVRRTPPP